LAAGFPFKMVEPDNEKLDFILLSGIYFEEKRFKLLSEYFLFFELSSTIPDDMAAKTTCVAISMVTIKSILCNLPFNI
jgi:hypothetical protein